MGADELTNKSERELILLLLERVEGITHMIAEHEDDIQSLKETRASNSGFFRGVNWLIGLPGVLALLVTGKNHL